MMKRSVVFALTATAILTSGCSHIPLLSGSKVDYKSAPAESHALDVPPDLIEPATSGRFNIPDTDSASQATTWSAYARGQAAAQHPAANAAVESPQQMASDSVLPQNSLAHMAHDGSVRYLVVNGDPAQVWAHLAAFWRKQGFTLAQSDMKSGVMVTDWQENRAKIPQDGIRKLLGKLVDGLYSSDTEDRYRTRLERGTAPGTTEVYVAMEGMEEVPVGNGESDQFRWQRRPAEPEVEAEMLNRMLVSFGVPAAQAGTEVAAAAPAAQLASMTQADGAPAIALPDPFDRAWRRVGIALDRLGFTVVDLNRSAGTYYIRYVSDDTPGQSAGHSGSWLSHLEFWKSSADKAQTRAGYRIQVSANGEAAVVQVQDEDGKPDTTATGQRITHLLYTQLK